MRAYIYIYQYQSEWQRKWKIEEERDRAKVGKRDNKREIETRLREKREHIMHALPLFAACVSYVSLSLPSSSSSFVSFVSLSPSLYSFASRFFFAHFHPCHLTALLQVLFLSRYNFCLRSRASSDVTTGSPHRQVQEWFSRRSQGAKSKEEEKERERQSVDR